MAKLLALAYPLAVFTLFYLFFPFLTFFHLNLTQIQALNNKNNPKHPFKRGRGYYLQEIQTQKKNHQR
jgi:ABC-type transport system involved in multi-copper enzyme maturation permease subunit